jgi:nucleotide-binding universal stress UspA family protein
VLGRTWWALPSSCSPLGATLELVSAYERAPERRPRPEGGQASQRAQPAMDAQPEIGRRKEADASLADAASLARAAGVKVSTHARERDPADVLLDVAERHHADLLMWATRA